MITFYFRTQKVVHVMQTEPVFSSPGILDPALGG